MLFILSHPFRLRATPPAGRSGSRGGQADSRSSFLVKRTSPAAKRRPLATLFVSASAQAWFFVSSRNLRALGALRGFAVNPGLDFHREGAKHAKKTRGTLVWLRLCRAVSICTTNPKTLCHPARIFPAFLGLFFGVRKKLACALTDSEQTPREERRQQAAALQGVVQSAEC